MESTLILVESAIVFIRFDMSSARFAALTPSDSVVR